MPLPPLARVLDGAVVVALPMRVRFRGIDVREALLLRGGSGWGEFAPFTEYDDAESAPWLASALESAWTPWPAPVRARVRVNATVPAVATDLVADVLARFPGCTTAKVKVAQRGQCLADDLARVARVREVLTARAEVAAGAAAGAGDVGAAAAASGAVGPVAVRVDANGGWTVPDAVAALTALAADGPLEYAEQPCASVAELAALRARLAADGVPVPIAADESIRRADDPLAVARAGAADVAVLKVAPLGGVAAVLRIAAVLRAEHGLPVVVSSALDTAVGMGAGLAAAAALRQEPPACGLATGELLAADVAAPRPLVAGSLLAGERTEPDPALLAAHAASPQRREWWLARLVRVHAVLAAQRPAASGGG